jgi:hypothetical protein
MTRTPKTLCRLLASQALVAIERVMMNLMLHDGSTSTGPGVSAFGMKKPPLGKFAHAEKVQKEEKVRKEITATVKTQLRNELEEKQHEGFIRKCKYFPDKYEEDEQCPEPEIQNDKKEEKQVEEKQVRDRSFLLKMKFFAVVPEAKKMLKRMTENELKDFLEMKIDEENGGGLIILDSKQKPRMDHSQGPWKIVALCPGGIPGLPGSGPQIPQEMRDQKAEWIRKEQKLKEKNLGREEEKLPLIDEYTTYTDFLRFGNLTVKEMGQLKFLEVFERGCSFDFSRENFRDAQQPANVNVLRLGGATYWRERYTGPGGPYRQYGPGFGLPEPRTSTDKKFGNDQLEFSYHYDSKAVRCPKYQIQYLDHMWPEIQYQDNLWPAFPQSNGRIIHQDKDNTSKQFLYNDQFTSDDPDYPELKPPVAYMSQIQEVPSSIGSPRYLHAALALLGVGATQPFVRQAVATAFYSFLGNFM